MRARTVESGQEMTSGSPVTGRLLSAYYDELRLIARRILGANDGRMTLQPTDLMHEAAMRLLASTGVWVKDEAHFLALSARVIRTTLIDEIRRRAAAKRNVPVMTIWEADPDSNQVLNLEEFDSALTQLAGIEPEGAKIVELRFYAGMTMEEIARELDISESTALRRWRVARAWLFNELAAAA